MPVWFPHNLPSFQAALNTLSSERLSLIRAVDSEFSESVWSQLADAPVHSLRPPCPGTWDVPTWFLDGMRGTALPQVKKEVQEGGVSRSEGEGLAFVQRTSSDKVRLLLNEMNVLPAFVFIFKYYFFLPSHQDAACPLQKLWKVEKMIKRLKKIIRKCTIYWECFEMFSSSSFFLPPFFLYIVLYCSVAKLHFDSLWPCGLEHARLSCPSLFSGVCSNSCPLNWWCHPTSSSFVAPFFWPQSFPASESVLCIRWPKYWSFSFSISLSNEYSGLISLRIGWFHLLAVQETLRNLLQHHNLKVSIFWHSAFFMVQFSLSVLDCWKTISFDQTDLCRQSDVSAF